MYHNPQSEKSLIWLIVNNPNNLPKIAARVNRLDFYTNIARYNFESALRSYQQTGFVDVREFQMLSDFMDGEYVSDLWIPKLCDELRECRKKRGLLTLSEAINKSIESKDLSELVADSMNALTFISSFGEPVKTDARTIYEKVSEEWKQTKELEIIGLPCGFSEIDNLISGFRPSHIWVVGGYTNYGKSTLAISFLSHLLKTSEEAFLFCSTEMSQGQIFEKIVSNFTRETPDWNRKHCYSPQVRDAALKISKTKLQITDDLVTIEAIVLKIQEMVIGGNKPKVVFIDFIQNIQGKGQSEYERITNAILELQLAARRLNVCIVVLSQVNNQSAGMGEVMGFKSSGALAAAADITIQIVRDKAGEMKKAKENVATEWMKIELLVQKNRHGRGGMFPYDFELAKGLIINH